MLRNHFSLLGLLRLFLPISPLVFLSDKQKGPATPSASVESPSFTSRTFNYSRGPCLLPPLRLFILVPSADSLVGRWNFFNLLIRSQPWTDQATNRPSTSTNNGAQTLNCKSKLSGIGASSSSSFSSSSICPTSCSLYQFVEVFAITGGAERKLSLIGCSRESNDCAPRKSLELGIVAELVISYTAPTLWWFVAPKRIDLKILHPVPR